MTPSLNVSNVLDVSTEVITKYLKYLANPEVAEHSQRFFKTKKGQYGYGDVFLGIRVPVIRKAVKQFKTASLDTTQQLLKSKYHEIRLFALLLLIQHFNQKAEFNKVLQVKQSDVQKQVFDLYLSHTQFINNWDLVDSSAPYIVGAYLMNRDRSILLELAQSDDLWQRRIAIIASFYFIKQQQFSETLQIAELLLADQHDLIHKAVGWMLREIGNRDRAVEEAFLKPRYQTMPRTMLRYAIEKFPKPLYQQYLRGEI
ncbi:MAG: hypothetical protein ISEC1_P0767 [Thiomicrorhabdus sp.]|nr:MAG: hypothetical protein ISEC1_P0767 [Thiomicrorhabdus sp.]